MIISNPQCLANRSTLVMHRKTFDEYNFSFCISLDITFFILRWLPVNVLQVLCHLLLQQAVEALFNKYADKHKIVDLIHDQYRKQEKKVFTMRRELEYLETYMADQYEINLQKASTNNWIFQFQAHCVCSCLYNCYLSVKVKCYLAF